MTNSLIKELQAGFGNVVSWHDVPNRLTKEGWYLLEINPFPNNKELKLIVSDIENGRAIGVTGGKLTHLDNCDSKNHTIKSNIIRKALKDIREKTFLVAVYVGKTSFTGINNQPMAIALEPEISYDIFPDHPHLNAGAYDKFNKFYFPNSFCYTDDLLSLGIDKEDRLLNAFSQISIWLFRHQIWEESRKYKKAGEWVGPEADGFNSYEYPTVLNPHGLCRCGSGKNYILCHRPSDLNDLGKKIQSDRLRVHQHLPNIINYISVNRWINEVGLPQANAYQELKTILLSN